MTGRNPFDGIDRSVFETHAEDRFDTGSFDPIADGGDDRDLILVSSIESTRAYMRESFGARNAEGEDFRVYPGIINTLDANAFAAYRQGVHLCGVSAGLYGGLHELALFLFTQADTFPECGDPASERSPGLPPGGMLSFIMIDDLRTTGGAGFKAFAPDLMPQTAERYEMAIYLTQAMLRFVWFHELYHGLNGHVRYLAQFGTAAHLDELTRNDSALDLIQRAAIHAPPAKAMQMIELDADRTALWASYQLQIMDRENIIGIAKLSKRLRCKLTLCAGYLMTFLFDQAARRRAQSVATHPDPYTRLHNLIRTTATHLMDADHDTQSVFREVLAEFRRIRRAVPDLVDPARILADCEAGAIQDEMDRADALLETLRSKFSRFGYADPSQPRSKA